jgi:hypothetical protein
MRHVGAASKVHKEDNYPKCEPIPTSFETSAAHQKLKIK